jgi:hypothetical protein
MEAFMSYELDWRALGESLAPRTDKLKFEQVKHLFKKVAWDAYKPLSGSETLWELREEDDGQYLYAVYGDEETLISKASVDGTNDWSATSDREGKNVTLSFKHIPIKRFAASEYGFTPSEAGEFAAFLTSKASDQEFIAGLVSTLPEAKKIAVAQLINKREA